jgi:hypothetical protein
MNFTMNGLPSRWTAAALAALMLGAGTLPLPAHADCCRGSAASELSALSMLPISIAVSVPTVLLVGASGLTVAAVEVSADGTVWLLERASDGARTSVHFAGHASAAVGTAVVVTAVSAGWILSAAGTAIAYIPNELGRALMHNERLSR